MSTDTWFPAVGTRVRCIDTSYTACPERPYVGQTGKVKALFRDMEWSGHNVLVIEFDVDKSAIPSTCSNKRSSRNTST